MAPSTDRYWNITNVDLPVGTLYCIGRNYAAHTAEMGAQPSRDPIVFIKPPAAYTPHGGIVRLPVHSTNVHHEVEMVLVMSKDIVEIQHDHVWDAVLGVGIGLDLTARDVQKEAKASGNPWSVSKSWIGSAPISPIVPLAQSGKGPWDISLEINGSIRQQGSTANMERSIEELVSYIAATFSLRAGDAILTGTPDGVGPVVAGDVAVARLGSIAELTVRFV